MDRTGSHRPTWLAAATVAAGGLLAAVVVGAVLRQVRFHTARDPLARWDREVFDRVRVSIDPPLTGVMRVISWLGSFWVMLAAGLPAVRVSWRRRKWSEALGWLVTIVGAGLLNQLYKAVYRRPRPPVPDPLVRAGGWSYPSGHAMVSAAVYGITAYLWARLAGGGRLKTSVVWLLAGALVGLVGLSRVYLGVHYPSDVLAGWLAGLAWLAGAVGLTRRLRRLRQSRASQPALQRQVLTPARGRRGASR